MFFKIRKIYLSVFAILLLSGFLSNVEGKWIGFGSDDPWNEGIMDEMGKVEILRMEKGSNGNPHLLLSFKDPDIYGLAFNYYYLFWDGEKWRGLDAGSPFTHLTFLDGESTAPEVELRIDTLDRPHIAWTRVLEGFTIQEMAYRLWDGEKWIGLAPNEYETVILRFEPSSKFSILLYFEFEVDSLDNPHILYYGYPSGEPKNSYYIYWNGEEFTTFGDSDTGKGIFAYVNNDFKLGSCILKLDSNDFPHLSTTFKPAEDNSKMQLYTFWDGEKWTGINGSDEDVWLPYSYHEVIFFYYDDFALDVDDNPHFVYYADIEGGKYVLYNYWNGRGWSGLTNDEDYTILNWVRGDEFPQLKLQLDNDNGVHFISHKGSHSKFILYRCWENDRWYSYAGSDLLTGVKPNGAKEFGLVFVDLEFYIDGDNKPIIGSKFRIGNNDLDFTSVIKWEEEYDPTVEIYFWDREYLLTGDEVKFHCRLHNPWEGEFKGNLYIALMDPMGKIYFFPGWGEEMNFTPISLAGGFILPWTEIISFDIPSETPPINMEGMHYFGIFLEDGIKGGFVSYDVKGFRVVRE